MTVTVTAYIDGQEFEIANTWKFPGGEVGVKLQSPNHMMDFVVIKVTEIPTSDDLMIVMNMLDSLKRTGIPSTCISLVIPYLPYARQDRVCSEGESFALKVFTDVLATNIYFRELIVWDIHSSVIFDNPEINENLKNKVINIAQFNFLESTVDTTQYDYLIAPDAGAAKKLKSCNVITLHKTRLDGKVIHAELDYGILSGKNVLVVDDICDGGATFLSIAEMFERTGNKPVVLDLYVTHGIFSKGVDILKKKFNNIYSANLMNPHLVYLDGTTQIEEKELS